MDVVQFEKCTWYYLHEKIVLFFFKFQLDVTRKFKQLYSQKDGECTHNVTLWHLRVTIVAVCVNPKVCYVRIVALMSLLTV